MAHKAFLAMPFRPELTWVREAIRRAVEQLAIDLRVVDETVQPGEDLVAEIRQAIREATIAYVVLIDLNPNVMYELGLLHEASKPTILLGDSETLARLPFDIKTRMVVTFELRSDAAASLTSAVVTATCRLLALLEPKARKDAIHGPAPVEQSLEYGVQFSIGQLQWEKIKNDGAQAVGRKGCTTKSISPCDDGGFKGWKLKARCAGGDTINIYVDLNGDIASIDVE